MHKEAVNDERFSMFVCASAKHTRHKKSLTKKIKISQANEPKKFKSAPCHAEAEKKTLKIFSMSTDKAAAVLSQVATQRINFFIMREGGNRISYNRASHYQLITS